VSEIKHRMLLWKESSGDAEEARETGRRSHTDIYECVGVRGSGGGHVFQSVVPLPSNNGGEDLLSGHVTVTKGRHKPVSMGGSAEGKGVSPWYE